ncbi:MAG TPA: type I 3-dehydroquinate dehydratase [Vicinamibacterales bacterium]|nr:type I 3-dehydroquinate dehydratase [Vicinamibacterales bacterium]
MGDSSRSRICATVGGATMAELRRARDEVRDADIVEVRLDTVSDPDAAGALAGRTRPVLVTCRASWEGGGFRGSEEERIALLTQAWSLGAEYVDLEERAPAAPDFLERTGGRRVVLSRHDFHGAGDVRLVFRSLASSPAEIVKLAVTARRVSDTLPLFELHRDAGDRRFIALAMGNAGLPTRILAARIGSAWSYAGSAAPGQIPVARLIDEFRFRSLGAASDIYGVVGNPIMHSLSPAMHNAAFDAAGIDAVYLPIEAADAADFLNFAEGIGLKGASVTAPFKIALAGCVRLDADARRLGALNTLRRAGEGWEGTNTDPAGFLAPLEPLIPLRGTRASVLGAGGAARAAAAALRSRGAIVTIHARREEQAADVAAALDVAAGPWPPPGGSWDLLVNATPVGTGRPDETPLPDFVFDGRLVYDLIYYPPVTRLLRDASAAGCATLGGLEMLVAQAQAQFEWWTGVRPNADMMRTAALRRLAADGRNAQETAPAAASRHS